MDANPKRDELRKTAYEWSIKNLPQFFDCLNRTHSDEDAEVEYHGMVDGIVWTDELPGDSSVDLPTLRKIFCVLIHTRTSQVLGETVPHVGIELMAIIRENCPNWCFNKPDRWTSSRRTDYERVRIRFFGKLDQAGGPLDANPKLDH